MPWVDLQCVIVVFPDQANLLFNKFIQILKAHSEPDQKPQNAIVCGVGYGSALFVDALGLWLIWIKHFLVIDNFVHREPS